jgi:hypothetical protein
MRSRLPGGHGSRAVTCAARRVCKGRPRGTLKVLRDREVAERPTTGRACRLPSARAAPHPSSWKVQPGWKYRPVPAERIVLKRDQRLVARITAPADEITLNGELF